MQDHATGPELVIQVQHCTELNFRLKILQLLEFLYQPHLFHFKDLMQFDSASWIKDSKMSTPKEQAGAGSAKRRQTSGTVENLERERKEGRQKKDKDKTWGKPNMEMQINRLEKKVKTLGRLLLKTEEDTRELKSLTSWSFVLGNESELGKQLAKQMQIYKEKMVRGKPHELGPPRRGLTLIIVEWLLKNGECKAEFKEFHQNMKNPEDLDSYSLHQCYGRVTKKELVLIRMNAYKENESVWADNIHILFEEAKKHGGEVHKQKAPPGPEVREIKSWAYKRDQEEEEGGW